MHSSDQPKLPSWIFIATDLALIGLGVAIAYWSPHPLSGGAIVAIVVCVALGALFGLLPLVVSYERQKNETLDERQRSLEALARTVNSSAEQISIAANGLHEISELALKNLRMAEHLPHKLQDKIAEFQAQVAASTDAEKEELERELLALRTTESERLEAVAQRIAKSAGDWSKLEAATHQHLTAATDALGKLAHGAAQALTNAQAAAEQALTHARVESARTMGEAAGKAAHAVETARASALAELDARLAAATTVIVDRVVRELGARLTPPAAPVAPAEPTTPVAASNHSTPDAPSHSVTPEATGGSGPDFTPPPEASSPAPEASAPTPAPRKPRRIRREEATAAAVAAAADSVEASSHSQPVAAPAEEPPPVPVTAIPEITPVAPATAEPFTGHIATVPNGDASSAMPETASTPDPLKALRRRAGKKPEDDGPGLGLDMDDSGGAVPDRSHERVLTSDGATRLIATAYIGIGNRLFIRGQGPGLSWDKGVPLQFVSIGKWRWETNDATAPVQYKLYKNDEFECAALGQQSLDPGYQQEVSASF